MVKNKSHILIFFLLPLSLAVVFWLYEINFIAYADFSPPQSQIRATRRYEEGREMNKGTIEKVRFLQSNPKPITTKTEVKVPNNEEKKKDLPAWMTVLSAVGLLGASQALKKENSIPVAPKEEFTIMKVPRTIIANVTNMVDKTVEIVKNVPYTVYETAHRTVDKIVDVTKQVAETVYETVKEKVVQPVTEIYDKAVQKTKQVTEYVAQKFEEVSQVARTVVDKVERTVEKVVPVIRSVTDYVTTKVEEAYQYATQVTRNVAEWVMTPVKEAYEVVREVPRQVTDYVKEKVKQTKEVARTVYDDIKRTAVWFEDKASTVWDEVRETKTRLVEKFEDARRWVGDTYRTVTERIWGKTGDSVRYEDVPVYGMVAETSTSLIKRGWQWLRSTTTKWVSKVVSWTKRKIIEPVYGWVSRSYQQLAEAGHWVTDRVRHLVNEAYTEIKRVPRTIIEKVRHAKEWIEKVPRTVYDTVTEWVEKTVPVVRTVYDKVKDTAYRIVQKPVQIVKQVAETVWNTATRLVDKVTPVIRQVTDYVTEKVKEVVEVPRTIYENIVNVVEKVVPVVKDVAYTAYEKAERIVDKVVEVSKEVAKTVYKQVTEKVVQPIVEAYEVAVEKFKEVKEYVTVKTPEVQQISRTVYDEVKVPVKKTIHMPLFGIPAANAASFSEEASSVDKNDLKKEKGKGFFATIVDTGKSIFTDIVKVLTFGITQPENSATAPSIATILVDGLRVRSEPSSARGDTVISQLNTDDKVEVIGKNEDGTWLNVRLSNGVTAWISNNSEWVQTGVSQVKEKQNNTGATANPSTTLVPGKPANWDSLTEADQKKVQEILTIPSLDSLPQNKAIADYFSNNILPQLNFVDGALVGSRHGTGNLQCKPWLQSIVIKNATGKTIPSTKNNDYEWNESDQVGTITSIRGKVTFEEMIKENSVITGDIVQMHYKTSTADTPHTMVFWKADEKGVWAFDTNFGTYGEYFNREKAQSYGWNPATATHISDPNNPGQYLKAEENATHYWQYDNTVRLHHFSYDKMNTASINATVYRVNQ